MKKLIIPALLLSLFSCKNEGSDKFRLSGTVSNNPTRQTVYLDLLELDAAAPQVVDTVTIEPGNAAFKLEGRATEEESMYRLRFGSDGGQFLLLVGDRKDIELNADWKNLNGYTTNSAASNSFQGMLRGMEGQLKKMEETNAQLNTAATDSAKKAADEALKAQSDATQRYLMKYADTTKSPVIAMYIIGPLLGNQVEAQQLEPLFTSMSKRFSGHPGVQKLVQEYFAFMQKRQSNIQPGKPAPDFSLPDPNGKMVSLSSFRGKYVLVDFWASWCGPCRMENPNVVEAYQKFSNKNFTVLGVSLDKAKDPWVHAIAGDNLNWTHVSDLKYWDSQVVPMYNIEGIPFNVLVDPQGTIVAMNLRGPALHSKLEEVLK